MTGGSTCRQRELEGLRGEAWATSHYDRRSAVAPSGRGEGARGCACDLRASTRRMREEEKSGHTTAEYPVVATRTFKGCAPWREAVTTTVKRFNLDDPASGPHEWQPD